MVRGSFDEHLAVTTAAVDQVVPALERVVAATTACLGAGGKVLVFGNGGSASQAQHFAAELTGRFEAERQAWPALALTADQATVTAIANDYGYERVFARQVEALGRPGDLVVAISTSGTSANVVAGIEAARAAGCTTAALTGEGGGTLADLVDLLVTVPSGRTARIQEIHTICLHAWCEAVEAWTAAGSA